MKSRYYTVMWSRRVMGQVKWTTINYIKGQSSSKECDVVYMVGLQGGPLLWAPSGKPKGYFQQVLHPIKSAEGITWQKVPEISQQKMQSSVRISKTACLMTREKPLQLGWEVLTHQLYSPDIAPSDVHLFQSLKNSLNGKKFQFPERLLKSQNSSLLKKIKSFEKMELWSCLKNNRG